jgi:hypothetical protein
MPKFLDPAGIPTAYAKSYRPEAPHSTTQVRMIGLDRLCRREATRRTARTPRICHNGPAFP